MRGPESRTSGSVRRWVARSGASRCTCSGSRAIIYGRHAEVEFFTRLREERRFDSLDALLKSQIALDVQSAREFFAAQMLG